MQRAALPALALAGASLMAGPAKADIAFQLLLKGYSETFRECEFDIRVAAPKKIARVVLQYRVSVPKRGTSDCRVTFEGPRRIAETSCHGARHLDFRCEAPFTVVPTGLGCYAAGGADIDCGEVSLTAPRAGLFVFQ